MEYIERLKIKVEEDIRVGKKFRNIMSSAKERGIPFLMTFSEVKRLLKLNKCYFTGVELNDIENDKNQLTFDRLDNDKGYLNGNVVACSSEFNKLKSSISIKQVRQIVKAFKKKNIW